MLFKLKEGSRTRGHKAALVKEQCRLDMRKYSSSQTVITEWNKLSNDCVNGGKGGLYIDDQIVGLSISRWQNRAGQFSMTHVNNRTAGPVTSFFSGPTSNKSATDQGTDVNFEPLSTCHLELVVWDGNLVKSYFVELAPLRHGCMPICLLGA